MNIGEAIEEMKNGRRARRKVWGEADVWCCYLPPVKVPEEKVNDRIRQFIPEGPLEVNGYFVIFYGFLGENGVWQPGWGPTQDDIQAFDWEVQEPPGALYRPGPPKLVLAKS